MYSDSRKPRRSHTTFQVSQNPGCHFSAVRSRGSPLYIRVTASHPFWVAMSTISGSLVTKGCFVHALCEIVPTKSWCIHSSFLSSKMSLKTNDSKNGFSSFGRQMHLNSGSVYRSRAVFTAASSGHKT